MKIKLKNLSIDFYNETKKIYDIIYEKSSNNSTKKIKTVPDKEYSEEDIMEKINSFIYKIKKDYHHEKIKNKINDIIDHELKNLFKVFFDTQDTFVKFLEKFVNIENVPKDQINISKDIGFSLGIPSYISDVFFTALKRHLVIINNHYLSIFVLIIDLFFLRRFLDKDYVTNGVSYSGASHSVNYIYILVKYFGFKITNYHYLKIKPAELEKKIKDATNPRDIDEYIYPEYLYQCTDMTNFPELFK